MKNSSNGQLQTTHQLFCQLWRHVYIRVCTA